MFRPARFCCKDVEIGSKFRFWSFRSKLRHRFELRTTKDFTRLIYMYYYFAQNCHLIKGPFKNLITTYNVRLLLYKLNDSLFYRTYGNWLWKQTNFLFLKYLTLNGAIKKTQFYEWFEFSQSCRVQKLKSRTICVSWEAYEYTFPSPHLKFFHASSNLSDYTVH